MHADAGRQPTQAADLYYNFFMHPDPLPPSELFNFHSRVVLVTGAGRGLGAAIARRFAQAGAQVAVHYHSSSAAALELVSALERNGVAARAFPADLTQEEAVRSMFSEVRVHFGRLDVLVNNAGTYPVTPLLELSAAEWEQVLAANLRSLFLCTREAARGMVEAGEGGVIINIATIEAEHPAPGHSHYDAAKAGVIAFTRSAALELGGSGIRVNAVSPGLIWRKGIEDDWPQGVASWQAAAPLGRMGQPHEVADACLFLASPAARWITGTNLVVDGGISARSLF